MKRFTDDNIWCIGCASYHLFDNINDKVCCPKEHPEYENIKLEDIENLP